MSEHAPRFLRFSHLGEVFKKSIPFVTSSAVVAGGIYGLYSVITHEAGNYNIGNSTQPDLSQLGRMESQGTIILTPTPIEPTTTPIPVSGLEADAPQDEYNKLLNKIAAKQASETEIAKFNRGTLERNIILTWFTKEGEEKPIPEIRGLTPKQRVVEGRTPQESTLIIEYFNDKGELAAYLNKTDGSIMKMN